MSTRRWYQFAGNEETLFKQVPEGWLYRAPNLWLVGPARHFVLNDAQKSQVATIHRHVSDGTLLGIIVLAVAVLPLTRFVLPPIFWLELSVAVLLGLVLGVSLRAYLVAKIDHIIANAPSQSP